MTIPLRIPPTSRARRYAFWFVGVVSILCAAFYLRSEARMLGDIIAYELRPPTLVVKAESSWVSLGFYDPIELRSPDSLPAPIRARLDSILDQRVGPTFRRRLTFVHSVFADHADSTFRAETEGVRWRRFEYRVGYAWLAPADGVLGYIGYITLYPDNRIPADIEFPDVAQHPQLGSLIPLEVARDSARAYGVRAVHVSLEYDGRRGRLHYQLVGVGRDLGGYGSNPVAIIDAHTGQLVRVTEFNWIS